MEMVWGYAIFVKYVLRETSFSARRKLKTFTFKKIVTYLTLLREISYS
jgi:hypothetical protein